MKKIINNITHIFIHLIFINNNFVCRLFRFINRINIFLYILTTLLFYYLGIVINNSIPFPKFNFFQTLFVSINVIAFFSIRYFEKQMKELQGLMSGDKALHPINDKVYRLRYSTLNLIVPPLAGTFFGVLALILVNVNMKSLSALYLILTYAVCVLVSFWGYLQYVYLLVYIWMLGHNVKKITMYNKDYPSNTKWVFLLAKLYSNYRNVFFVLGAAFCFGVIYFVLCGDYKVIEKISVYEWCQIPLLLFWGSVFLAIVIFFPISSIIEYINIRKIVENLKNQTVVEINRMVPEYSESCEMKIQKSYLIIAITNTPDYPFKDKLGIAFSTLITFINLASSVTAILEYTIK